MQDQRKLFRTRTFFGGTIAYNKRCSTLNCTVRGLSDSGALLELADTGTLPNNFDLIIRARNLDRPVRVVWRGEKEAGVAFEA